jgi:hypothetical protein
VRTPPFAFGLPVLLLGALLLTSSSLTARQANEQEEEDCTVLCAPELKFEPTVTVENLFAAPRVVELEAEVNIPLLTPEESGCWVDAHVDVIDKLSPAARPDDARLFTTS